MAPQVAEASSTTPDGQVILEETIDENYEPTQQEIHEYAQWLGMDVEKEASLLWIAREGLKAPLPKPWKPCKTPTGDIYYFNFSTGESIWDHPCDKKYRAMYQEEKAKKLQQRQRSETPSPKRSAAASPTPAGGRSSPPPARAAAAELTSPKKDSDSMARLKEQMGMPAAGGSKGVAASAATGKLAPLQTATSASTSASASGSDWPNFGPGLAGKTKLGSGLPAGGTGQAGAVFTAAAQPGPVPNRSITTSPVPQTQPQSRQPSSDELEEGQRARLAEFQAALSVEEAAARRRLQEGSEAVLAEYRRQMEAREARLKEEAALAHQKAVAEATTQHNERLAALRKELADAEAKLAAQVGMAKAQAQEAVAVTDADRAAARAAAVTAMEAEAAAEAAAQKTGLRQRLLEAMRAEVEDELRPLRAVRMEEGLKAISLQVDAAVTARKQEMSSLDNQVADQRRVLAQLEAQISQRKVALQGLQADEAACKTKVSRLETELSSLQRKVASLERDVCAKTEAFDTLLAKAQDAERQAAAAARQLADTQAQVTAATSELATLKSKAAAAKAAREADEAAGLQAAADHSANAKALAGVTAQLQERRAALEELGRQVEARRSELAGVCTDLAKGKAGVLTQDVGLAGQLRTQAGAEFAALEHDLARVRADLVSVAPELARKQAELQACQDELARSSGELADKQRRAARATAELAAAQSQLQDVETQLASQRQQLDTVSALLATTTSHLEKQQQQQQQQQHLTAGRIISPSLFIASSPGRSAAPSLLLSPQPSAANVAGGTSTDPVVAKSLQLLVGRPPAPLPWTESESGASIPPQPYNRHQQPLLPDPRWPAPAPAAAAAAAAATPVATPAAAIAARLHAELAAAGRDVGRKAAALSHARQQLRDQKRAVRDSQAGVHAAITNWRASVALVEREVDPTVRQQQARLLRSVKGLLEEQAQRVNAEATTLAAVKDEVRALEAAAAAAGGMTALPTRRQRSASAVAARSLRTSLDKIGRALEEALSVTAPASSGKHKAGGTIPAAWGKTQSSSLLVLPRTSSSPAHPLGAPVKVDIGGGQVLEVVVRSK